jgi:hypothetical protein
MCQLETLASKTTKLSHRFCDCVVEETMGGPDSFLFGDESHTVESRHVTYLSSFSAASITAGSDVAIDFVFLSHEEHCYCSMARAKLLYRKSGTGTATGSTWKCGAGNLLTISWGEGDSHDEDTSKLVWLMGALGIEKASKAEFLAVILGHALPLSHGDVADWVTDKGPYDSARWCGPGTKGSILEKALPLVAQMASSAEEDEDDEEEDDEDDDELVTCAPKKKPQ